MKKMKRFHVPRHWTLAQRLAYYSRPGPNGCVLWTGNKDGHGYGALKWQRKKRQAPRLAWEDAKGPIPAETPHVLHYCDVPACINLNHLWLGTHAQNMADRDKKGRHVKRGQKQRNLELRPG